MFWSDDVEQSDDDSDASEEVDVEAGLRSKKAPKESLKVPSKRGQDGPTPAIRKKRRPHVEVDEALLLFTSKIYWCPNDFILFRRLS